MRRGRERRGEVRRIGVSLPTSRLAETKGHLRSCEQGRKRKRKKKPPKSLRTERCIADTRCSYREEERGKKKGLQATAVGALNMLVGPGRRRGGESDGATLPSERAKSGLGTSARSDGKVNVRKKKKRGGASLIQIVSPRSVNFT